MVRRLALLVFLVLPLSLLSLSGCGERICVGGIGDCAIEKKSTGKDNQVGTDGQFQLSTTKKEVLVGESTEITIQNTGTDWTVEVSNGGPVNALTKTGTYTIQFKAVETITGQSQYTVLKGVDKTRYKSDSETPLAWGTIMITTNAKKK